MFSKVSLRRLAVWRMIGWIVHTSWGNMPRVDLAVVEVDSQTTGEAEKV